MGILMATGIFAIALLTVYILWEHMGLKEFNAKLEQNKSESKTIEG